MTDNERGALEDSKHVRPQGCICNPFDLAAMGHMTNCPVSKEDDEDDECCPPHCCCCDPGDTCCDCGEVV